MHAQGVKQSVCPSVIVIVVGTKIARSQALGICVCCKYNKSVDICEKLVSVCFKLLDMAHQRYKLCIFCSACLWFIDRTHSVGYHTCANAARLCMLDLNVGKGCQVVQCVPATTALSGLFQYQTILRYIGCRAHGVCTLESSS